MIATLTAVAMVAELHDRRRFASAPRPMAYLGLVPSEHSSGGKRRLGAITELAIDTYGACWWKPPGTIATNPRSVCSYASGAWGSRPRSPPAIDKAQR